MTPLSALKSLLHYADPVPDALTDSSFVTITCTARSIRAAQALASVDAERLEADGLEELIALLFSEAELRHKKLLCPIERTYEHRAATALRTLSERALCGREGIETEFIERAIVEWVGERCPDFDPDCDGCRTWRAYDALTPSPPPESQDITPERIREAKLVYDKERRTIILETGHGRYTLTKIAPPTRNSQQDNEGERG